MTEPSRTPPRDDAQLALRIAEALHVAPATPSEQARFAARVRERVERRRSVRWQPLAALGGLAAAAIAAGVALAPLAARDGRPPVVARDVRPTAVAVAAPAPEALTDSWQDELLYAPEWIESDKGFVDAEILPESYAVASALLEP